MRYVTGAAEMQMDSDIDILPLLYVSEGQLMMLLIPFPVDCVSVLVGSAVSRTAARAGCFFGTSVISLRPLAPQGKTGPSQSDRSRWTARRDWQTQHRQGPDPSRGAGAGRVLVQAGGGPGARALTRVRASQAPRHPAGQSAPVRHGGI